MACRLFDAKPISEPMLPYYHNLRTIFQWNFIHDSKVFIEESVLENVVSKMAAILSRRQRVNRRTYTFQIEYFIKLLYLQVVS